LITTDCDPSMNTVTNLCLFTVTIILLTSVACNAAFFALVGIILPLHVLLIFQGK